MTYEVKTFTVSFCYESTPQPEITSEVKAAAFARSVLSTIDADKEHMILVAVGTSLEPIGFKCLFTGGFSSCTVDVATILRAALILGGNSFFLVHNHPSQNQPSLSEQDKETARQIGRACEICKMTMVDFLVIGRGGFCSLKQGCQGVEL